MVKEMKGRDAIAAQVNGTNSAKKQISFSLSVAQIKHIRRCLRFYRYIHPIEYRDGEELLENFVKFGFRNSGRNSQRVKSFLENNDKKCAVCGTEENLTVDHKVQLSEGGGNGQTNLQVLCVFHHNEKNLKWRIELKKKELALLENNLERGLFSKKQVTNNNW